MLPVLCPPAMPSSQVFQLKPTMSLKLKNEDNTFSSRNTVKMKTEVCRPNVGLCRGTPAVSFDRARARVRYISQVRCSTDPNPSPSTDPDPSPSTDTNQLSTPRHSGLDPNPAPTLTLEYSSHPLLPRQSLLSSHDLLQHNPKL